MRIEAGLNDYADYSPIPPGTYEFVIKDPLVSIPVLDSKTDIGGNQYKFELTLEIVGGEQAGKKVFRRFTNKSKGSRYFLRSFLEKVGASIGEKGGFSSEDLLGKRFKAAVNDRLYKDDAGNEKKASDLDTESVVAL